VSPGVILAFNEGGRLVGIEILNARQRLPGADLKRVEFEIAWVCRTCRNAHLDQ